MSRIIMVLAGCLEIIAGVIFLFIVKFPAIAILLFISGILFIISGMLTGRVETNSSSNDDN